MSDLLQTLKERPLPLAKTLGIEFTAAQKDMVEARMKVRPEICTRPDILHGGAVMALADTVGAAATVINLPPGAGTTTIESKTNFLAAITLGDTAIARAKPFHRGKTTMVWQTEISRESDGRLAAVVTQTQMVLLAKG
jgi:1,4-dihydroxy-2-naphthoyl-CoA hydrolase